MTALSEMFQTARDIMKWLGDCAQVCFFSPVVILFFSSFIVELRISIRDTVI